MGQVMRITGLFRLLAVLAFAFALPARADWYEVRTNHFILTIDDSADGARNFAARLERFDAALRLLYSVADTADQRARPIRVYALQDEIFIATCRCWGVLGYYSPRVSGSFILSAHMPKTDLKAKTGGWSSQTLLLHEYSHHFMYSNFPVAYPFWYSEGFAEFNANVTFESDGSLVLGYPANYRASGILGAKVSIKQLFEPNTYGYPDDIDALYGRGWLLTHYLILKSQRAGQLSAYLSLLNKGMPSLTAARQAFGDLEKLSDELETYRRGKLGAPLRIPPGTSPLDVKVNRLSPGEEAMLPVYLWFTSGVGDARLGQAQRAQKIAGRYPDSAIVQEQLAEIEFLATRYDRADEAADRALRIAPAAVAALIVKGGVAVKRAQDAKIADSATWTAARRWLLKANRADPNAAMPLYLYYSSFIVAKAKPPAGAVTALMRAAVLAPESNPVRLALARQKLRDGDSLTARALLQPIAFAPHRKRDRNIPREIIALIDANKAEAAIALIDGDKEDSEE